MSELLAGSKQGSKVGEILDWDSQNIGLPLSGYLCQGEIFEKDKAPLTHKLLYEGKPTESIYGGFSVNVNDYDDDNYFYVYRKGETPFCYYKSGFYCGHPKTMSIVGTRHQLPTIGKFGPYVDKDTIAFPGIISPDYNVVIDFTHDNGATWTRVDTGLIGNSSRKDWKLVKMGEYYVLKYAYLNTCYSSLDLLTWKNAGNIEGNLNIVPFDPMVCYFINTSRDTGDRHTYSNVSMYRLVDGVFTAEPSVVVHFGSEIQYIAHSDLLGDKLVIISGSRNGTNENFHYVKIDELTGGEDHYPVWEEHLGLRLQKGNLTPNKLLVVGNRIYSYLVSYTSGSTYVSGVEITDSGPVMVDIRMNRPHGFSSIETEYWPVSVPGGVMLGTIFLSDQYSTETHGLIPFTASDRNTLVVKEM